MYNQAIVMSDKRQHLCTIDGNVVTEKYEGRNTLGYIGEYTTDGSNCNCSWFAAKYICRHLIYYRVTKNLPIFEKTMFHKSFVSGPQLPEVANESVDMFSSIIDDPSSVGPASPGMELLIEDQQAATKRLPKNVRFNQSFDVAKVVAEDLSKYNTEAFEEILECFKTFSLYMRNGFPANVLEFLRNPAKYEIREIDKIEKNIAQDLSTRLDSTMPVLSSTRIDSNEVKIFTSETFRLIYTRK